LPITDPIGEFIVDGEIQQQYQLVALFSEIAVGEAP
jgi:hypothetical protein